MNSKMIGEIQIGFGVVLLLLTIVGSIWTLGNISDLDLKYSEAKNEMWTHICDSNNCTAIDRGHLFSDTLLLHYAGNNIKVTIARKV